MADGKQTIDCPHCFARISHVEVAEERHGTMDIGGEIEYDLNSDNNGAPRYFCPQCQEEIDEELLIPEPQVQECARCPVCAAKEIDEKKRREVNDRSQE